MFKFIDIDPNRQIRSISVRSDPCGWIFGLRLMDEDGVNIVDANWNKVEEGDWVTKDIPEGEEIIGLKCDDQIKRIGFMCYRPCK